MNNETKHRTDASWCGASLSCLRSLTRVVKDISLVPDPAFEPAVLHAQTLMFGHCVCADFES